MNFVSRLLCLIALMIAVAYMGDASAQERAPAIGKWYDDIYSETKTHRKYVGGSYSHKTSDSALKAAYQHAVEEAINHNFGFTASNVQEFYQDKNSVEVKDQSQAYTDVVRLDGIKTIKRKVFTKSDGSFDAFVQISYSKEAIDREKERLFSNKKPRSPSALVVRPDEVNRRYLNDYKDHFLRISFGVTDANYVDRLPGSMASFLELGYQYRLFNSNLFADGYFKKGGSSSPSNISFSQMGVGLTYDFNRTFYGGAFLNATSYSYSRNNNFLDTSSTGYGAKAGAKLDMSQLDIPVTLFTEFQMENQDSYNNTTTNMGIEPGSSLNSSVSLGIKFGF